MPKRQTARKILLDLVWQIASDGLCNEGDPRQGVSFCEEDGDEYKTIVGSDAFQSAMRYLGFPRMERREPDAE